MWDTGMDIRDVQVIRTRTDVYFGVGAIDSIDAIAGQMAALADSRIYGLGGEYLGTDCSKLGGGVYIQNGRKHVIIR